MDHLGNCALALAISAGLTRVVSKLEAKLPTEYVQRVRNTRLQRLPSPLCTCARIVTRYLSAGIKSVGV